MCYPISIPPNWRIGMAVGFQTGFTMRLLIRRRTYPPMSCAHFCGRKPRPDGGRGSGLLSLPWSATHSRRNRNPLLSNRGPVST